MSEGLSIDKFWQYLAGATKPERSKKWKQWILNLVKELIVTGFNTHDVE